MEAAARGLTRSAVLVCLGIVVGFMLGMAFYDRVLLASLQCSHWLKA